MSGSSANIDEPSFPPLLTGEAVPARLDPFEKAMAAVLAEVEPGRIYWSQDAATMRATIVLAPEMPLSQAMGAAFAIQLGLSDSLGALAPPEVAVHFVWPDIIKVNGARCGRVRVAASHTEPTEEPEWLLIGVEQPVMPVALREPGEFPDETTLLDEGCADITATNLIESWSRHSLVWINRFLGEGMKPLHEAWRGKCDAIGEQVERPEHGLFVGLDEHGGMLLRQGDQTKCLPLTMMLDGAS